MDMTYDIVILGEDETLAITLHTRQCEDRIAEAAHAMINKHRATIVNLESDTPQLCVIETMFITGVKDKGRIRMCECVDTNGPGGWVPKVRTRVLSSGARAAVGENGTVVIACDNCGSPNPITRITCETCSESLWDTLRQRLFDKNRRLRSALKSGNELVVGQMRHEIATTIDGLGEVDKSKWSVGPTGQAVYTGSLQAKERDVDGGDGDED